MCVQCPDLPSQKDSARISCGAGKNSECAASSTSLSSGVTEESRNLSPPVPLSSLESNRKFVPIPENRGRAFASIALLLLTIVAAVSFEFWSSAFSVVSLVLRSPPTVLLPRGGSYYYAALGISKGAYRT